MLCNDMNSYIDPRDGKVYKTVKIGNQVWLAENLAYNAEGSKCYDDDESNCQKYGRLYDWETAMKACPKGWHLPSIDEVETLIVFADGDEIAMDKLKARSGWEFEENGTDDYGFAAMPGGFGRADGSFTLAGAAGGWWIAKKRDADRAYNWGISSLDIEVKRSADKSSQLFSVRCIQDYDPENTFTDPRDGKVYKTVKIGEQIWMAKNLAYAAEGSECYDVKYGRLYHWDTAMKSCPDGWHLPSKEEWKTLFDFVGGMKIAGKKLKATSGWDECDGKSGDGTDDFGFAALPGGYGDSDPDSDKWFPSSEGYYGEWWTSDFEEVNGVVRGVIRYMECTSGRIGHSVALNQFKMFSVRCIKDNKSKEQG